MTVLRVLPLCLFALTAACKSEDPCEEGGVGPIGVRVSGLTEAPVEVRLSGPANYTLTPPGDDSHEVAIAAAPTGRYTVELDADAYAQPGGPRVRRAVAAEYPLSVCPGKTFEVAFRPIATAQKLWLSTANGDREGPVAFDDAQLESPGAIGSPTFHGPSGAGSFIAFDRVGRLWAVGATAAHADLQRFDAPTLARDGGARESELRFTIAGKNCLPFTGQLAFDAQGNAWVSSPCLKQVLKLSTPALSESTSTLTPSSTLSGFSSVEGIAFDAAGNLWVADPMAGAVRRIDAEWLSTSPAGGGALVVHPKAKDAADDMSLLSPNHLAFDESGALWAIDVAANVIFALPASQLTGAGQRTVAPSARLSLSVTALPEGLGFDESGDLWLPLSSGTFGHISKAQLGVSTSSGAPTQPDVFSSPGLGQVSSPTFFPAPSWSPLSGNVKNL